MALWKRGRDPAELPWPLASDAAGVLPDDGQVDLAGIALPPGRARVPDDDFALNKGVPALWVADAITRNGPDLWKRLAREFGSTGLWPLLLESASHDPERPWLCGEFEGEESARDPRDAAEILAEWWSGSATIEEQGALPHLAPYSGSFPGLAPPTEGPLDLRIPGKVVARLRKTRFGLVPASRPADVVSAIGWLGGVNYGLEMPAVTRVLESWEDRYGAIVVGLGFDTMVLAVCRPPASDADALPVAAEHYALCCDNVDQGSETLEAYAREIAKSNFWGFWWD